MAETEAKQEREGRKCPGRGEEAETKKVQEENRQRAEQARIAAEEEIQISTQNQERQVHRCAAEQREDRRGRA